MGFSADIEGFAKRAGASVDETLRAVALELFGSVIKDTPVDTGRAKGNWQTSIGAPASGEVDRTGDGAALSEMRSVSAQFSGDKAIFLTNNLPYIRRLEYDGWSDQAPNGFVRKNVARIQSIVAKEARANKI